MAVYTETIALKDEVSDAAKKASDSVGGLAENLGGLNTGLAEATGGLSLVVEAIAGAAAAFGVLTVAGAAFAIKASEAKQASLALWDALGEGKISGEQVDDLLDNLRDKTGLTKDSLGKLSEQFLRMGVTGKDALEGLTIAAASAEALAKGGGDAFAKLELQARSAAEGGSKLTIPYKKLATQLQSVGLNTADLAKQMGMTEEALTSGFKNGTIDAKKFGEALQKAVTEKGQGPLQRMANSVGNLGKLLEEYIGDLFEDLGPAIAPFLTQVRDLFGILDSKANPSGKALKEGIEGFFKRVFAIATKVVPMVKHFLLDLIIYGLKAYIALKPLYKVASEFFVSIKNFAGQVAGYLEPIIGYMIKLAESQYAMQALSAMWTVLKVAIAAVAVVIGIAILAFVGIVAAAATVGIAIWNLIGTIGEFVGQVATVLMGWVDSAYEAASGFIMGLVNGIANGAGMVVDAVKGLAGKAVDGFKNALGIHSPSAVMMQLGGHTGEGFAQGIEAKSPDIHGAAQGMAGAAAIGASSGSSTSNVSNNNSKSINVTVEPGAIVINGGSGVSSIELTEEAVALVWERIALGAGL